MAKREPNAGPKFGEVKYQTTGTQTDDPGWDAMTINSAPDTELAYALAMRGYDVTIRVPSDEAIAMRKKRIERERRRREGLGLDSELTTVSGAVVADTDR